MLENNKKDKTHQKHFFATSLQQDYSKCLRFVVDLTELCGPRAAFIFVVSASVFVSLLFAGKACIHPQVKELAEFIWYDAEQLLACSCDEIFEVSS